MIAIPKYKIIEKIYEEGNSQVYRCICIENNLRVILKVLKIEFSNIQTIGRYKLEYEITRSLSSKFIINTYGFQEYQNRFIIILEDFGGESLAQILILRKIDIIANLQLAIQISEGLSHIHAANIIHKDINPSNIVFNSHTNILKIIDFGIASALPKENWNLDHHDFLEGTLAYISPEQTGRMNRSLDCRTDIYSMGVTFYQMFTGRLPYNSNDPLELIHHHLAMEPIAPHLVNSQIPLMLSNLILKMLAKTTEDRYQSAWGVKADLEKCLNQLETTGEIDRFRLAEQDIIDKFLISEKLYGRAKEVENLLAAFSRITDAQSDRVEILLISGYAGIGKSRLVQEIYKPITQSRGYFISGKFGQYQRNIPYFAIIQALKSLIKRLLTENEDRLNQWRSRIINALGINSYLITQVIPDLELIIGKQEANLIRANTCINESENRFNRVFQNFICVFAQSEHPLVIFLDDLQWADRASLKLLQILATTTAKNSLLLIGAYRDNEMSATHPMMQIIENIQQANGDLSQMLLSALNLTDITQLIADTLHCSTTEALSLAELVQQKTNGNPFFMNEFLKSLYDENLIKFNYQLRKWEWSIAQIQEQGITDNVVDLMAAKIQKLSDRTQYLLQIAACIGNQFDLETLVCISELSYADTIQGLMVAIAEGMILTLSNAHQSLYYGIELTSDRPIIGYKFVHDRIQQAAYSLISEIDRSALHYRIGKFLLEKAERLDHQLEDQVFVIANQFRLGIDQVITQTERDYLAQLHLLAGKNARLSYAYESSVQYCETGISLLAEDAWMQHPQMTQDLYLELITSACLTGAFKIVDTTIDLIQPHISSIQEQVKFIEVQIQSLIARNRLSEAIAIALNILQQLGVALPQQPDQLTTQEAFDTVSRRLANTENILDLPAMSNPQKLATMNILSNMSSAVYIGFPALYPLIVLKQVELSLQFGHSLETAYAFSTYGLIMGGGGHIDIGNQSANIALYLMDKFHAINFKAKIFNLVYHFIRPWQTPVRDCIAPLLEGYQAGVESGDLEFAAYCLFNHCQIAYFSGEHLLKVKQDMETYGEAIAQLKQTIALNFHQIGQQAVLNWIGESENPQVLIGTVYDEIQRLPLHIAAGDTYSIATVYVQKLILSYHFGQPQEALAIATIAEQHIAGAMGAVQFGAFYFYYALTLLANVDRSDVAIDQDIDKSISFSAEITKAIEKLTHWATSAPANFAHRYELVKAEMARVRGQRIEAMDLYDHAIALAQENQYFHEAALANELAAKFYLAEDKITIAKAYMQEARLGYLEWGALAKLQHLESCYLDLLRIFSADISSNISINQKETQSSHISISLQSSSSNLGNLDIESFLKASQAIAWEIKLDQLLETLMSILIENAGVQTGYLLLPTDLSIDADSSHQDQWTIAAIKTIEYERVVLQSIPINTITTDGHHYIPRSIVNYVIRTHQSVVLNNATQVGDFQNDPWIVQYQVKSLLCLPLLSRGSLTAIIVLENRLATDAFTRERLEVLNLLASQAAISIGKSRLLKQQDQLNQSLQSEISDRLLAESALKSSEAALQNLVAGTSAVTGDDFFPALVRHLAEALNVRYAVVTELIGDQLHTLASFGNGVPLPPVSFFTAYTPCKLALINGEYICNELVQKEFPENDILCAMQADSYMGISFKDINGNPIGNLSIIDVQPIQNISKARNILQVFAARASAELQRKAANQALSQLNQSLESRVIERTAQLEAANKELESFSYSVSHDLRAPLRAIDGFSRMLEEDFSDRLDTEGNRFLKIVRDNAKRMGELIDDLLNLSRLNRKEMSRRSVSVNTLIQQIFNNFAPELESRQIEFVIADLPDCQADISLLTQVWINLLSNAIKYTGKIKNARIEIGFQTTNKENEEIVYFVSDNGAGFDMQYADKLFGVFQRMHLEREFEGTGIGLAIAQRIVERHGGHIWAEAAVNQGATFYFTIPD